MLKNILKLNGAQEMSKKELQSINGGGRALCMQYCPPGCCVSTNVCDLSSPTCR